MERGKTNNWISTDAVVHISAKIDRVDDRDYDSAKWRLQVDFEVYENALIRAVKGFIEHFKGKG